MSCFTRFLKSVVTFILSVSIGNIMTQVMGFERRRGIIERQAFARCDLRSSLETPARPPCHEMFWIWSSELPLEDVLRATVRSSGVLLVPKGQCWSQRELWSK